MKRRKFLQSFGLLGLASIFSQKLLADKPDGKFNNLFVGVRKNEVNSHSLSGFSVGVVPGENKPKVSDRRYYSEIDFPVSVVSDDGVVTLRMKDSNLMKGHVVELFGRVLCYVKSVEDNNIVTLHNIKKERFYLSRRVKTVYIGWTIYE